MKSVRPLSAQAVLIAWEQGRHRHPVDRALLLRALSSPTAEPAALADEPLGRCNVALLEARAATFGARLRAGLDCPACGAALEFELNTSELLGAHPEPAGPVAVEIDGIRFRAPCHRDLVHIAGEVDTDTAASRLATLCALDGDLDEHPDIAEIELALERADPWSNPSLSLNCEECGHSWPEALDVPALFWAEVEHRAQMLLDEVHLLARAYGWTEGTILALSEHRRAAYLQRVLI